MLLAQQVFKGLQVSVLGDLDVLGPDVLRIGKDFFSFALGLSSKSKLELTVGTYEDVLTALINGDQKQNIIAAPNEAVSVAILRAEIISELSGCGAKTGSIKEDLDFDCIPHGENGSTCSGFVVN